MADRTPLRFQQPAPPAGPLHLRFGDSDGLAPGDAAAALLGRITGLRGHVGAAALVQARLHGRITGLRGHMGATWASDTDRPERAGHSGHWQAAQPAASGTVAAWRNAARASAGHSVRWQDAQPSSTAHAASWQQTLRQLASAVSHWQDAIAQAAPARDGYQQALRRHAGAIDRYQQAIAQVLGVRGAYQQTLRFTAPAASRYQQAIASGSTSRQRFSQHALHRHAAGIDRYQDARRPPPGHSPKPQPPAQPVCYDPAAPLHLRFIDLAHPAGPLHLRFACHRWAGGGDVDPPPATVIVLPRRSYIVINDIELRRVDGNLPLPAYTLAMSLDADSWTWQWSATLHKAALPLLAPARSGEPVEVEVKINGVPYRLLVESMRRSRQFAQTRIEVSGRGTAALLDAPYAATQQFGNPSGPRSAQQLMLDVLTINGVSIGWAVDWGLTDWQVPAGAWSHQGSYITALNAIAQAAGGYLQPHATARTLRVLPRYPVAPWDWGTLAPDIELPMEPVSVEGVEWVKKPDYTRVYVSGEGALGVLARITRTGTAGDDLAPMVTDALITHADAARQRGRAILSDTGAQAMVSLTLPVLPETGLILPGRFIRRTDGAEVLQGYVRGMSLAWDRPKMRQTLEVQTHG